MAYVEFASSIQRHAAIPPCKVEASTLATALDHVFAMRPNVRSYVLDDRGQVRKHMAIFINDQAIKDRAALSDPLQTNDRVYVIQALSGG
jgi:molybdopterin synthase sulfur carrier subunit